MSFEKLFEQELKVLNMGLEDFFETLVRSGVEVRQVEPDYSECDKEWYKWQKKTC